MTYETFRKRPGRFLNVFSSNFCPVSRGIKHLKVHVTHCVKIVLIQSYSECGKMWTRITPNTDTFHAVTETITDSLTLVYCFR